MPLLLTLLYTLPETNTSCYFISVFEIETISQPVDSNRVTIAHYLCIIAEAWAKKYIIMSLSLRGLYLSGKIQMQ